MKNKSKKFKWVVEFEVDELWVADGFELTKDRALEMLTNDLIYSYPHEVNVKINKSPKQRDILIAQGFKV